MNRRPLLPLAFAFVLCAAATGFADDVRPLAPAPVRVAPPEVPEIAPGILKGYLPKEALPDSASLLPPPPALASAAQARDMQIASEALKLRGTPRWDLAALDADLHFPHAASDFSCALGAPVSEGDTPRLYILLRRVMTDAGSATGAAKNKYRHARPFMMDSEPTCLPEADEDLRKNGSYPSGHTSIGWAWALVLTQASPGETQAIIRRGLSFGESRVVCNVHWESDILGGRVTGAATVARLQSDPQFRDDLAAAQEELATVRAKGLAPNRDCKTEAEALSGTPIWSP